MNYAITGAAGSIGSALSNRLRDENRLLIDIDETRLHYLWMGTGGTPLLCDIRDQDALDRAFRAFKPDVVIHAAAYKHVPFLERFPEEAVKTNVLGTANVVEASIANGVKKFVLISTDKAANSVCVMGRTKALAERVAVNAAGRGLHTKVVRFGNVYGTRGSVVPLFERQIAEGGPVTVTHPEVTRYFIDMEQAVGLILCSIGIGESGDILMLDMGEPHLIKSLAEDMIGDRDIEVVYTGLRPGEKLHEDLVSEQEVLVPVREGIFRVLDKGVWG